MTSPTDRIFIPIDNEDMRMANVHDPLCNYTEAIRTKMRNRMDTAIDDAVTFGKAVEYVIADILKTEYRDEISKMIRETLEQIGVERLSEVATSSFKEVFEEKLNDIFNR